MSITVTDSEKQQIKDLITQEMSDLSYRLRQQCLLITNKPLDEDTDLLHLDMKFYKHLTSLCTHLYNSDLNSYDPQSFWRCDEDIRSYILERFESTLNSSTTSNILKYLNSFKKHSS